MRNYSITDIFKTSWEQLTVKQIAAIIELSERLMKYELNSVQYGLTVIEILKTLRINKSAAGKIDEEQAVDCFNDINFFKRNAKGLFITPWYFFPVGSFWVNGVLFERPEMNSTLPMYNRIFDQLIYADSAFSNFCVMSYELQRDKHILTTQALKQMERDIDEVVNNLIAVLYQSPKDFDVARVEVNARLVPLKLTTMERTLILHTYANVKRFIVDRCPYLFPKPPELPEDAQTPGVESVPESSGPMWLRLRFDLAKTEVFKGLSTARNANIYEALDFMDQEAHDVLKQKPHAEA